VARGRPPRNGTDGHVLFLHIDERNDEQVDLRPIAWREHVDLREVDVERCVPAETVVARRIPAEPGCPGFDLSGSELPHRPGLEVSLEDFAGQGTRVSDDGCEILATAPGEVIRMGERIAVVDHYKITGDVDFETGNVRYDGCVTVTGLVTPGFELIATGNVSVEGGIDGAKVEAGGDLTAYKIFGKKSVVKAQGTVRASFISNATVEAGTDVWVERNIVMSTVSAEGCVVVKGPIMSSRVRAGEHVRCEALGSTAGWSTVVEAGGHEIKLRRTCDGKPVRATVSVSGKTFAGVTVIVDGETELVSEPRHGETFRGTVE